MPPAPPASLEPAALWERYAGVLISSGLNILAALAILLFGLWFSGFVAGRIKRWARRSKRADLTLGAFFASLARYGILAIVLIAVLRRFGIETTSIVAMLGAATLAIGLALQGTLSNVAAGVMLVMFRPYRIGDFVELAGQTGTVKDINIFVTELASLENIKVILPNGQCWGAPMRNFTSYGLRRVDVVFGISYNDDIGEAIAVLKKTVEADSRILNEPDAPLIQVMNLGAYSVDITVRVWAATADIMNVKWDLLRRGKENIEAAGLSIAYPTALQYEVLLPKKGEALPTGEDGD